jgi:class 3 adenylate cyclase
LLKHGNPLVEINRFSKMKKTYFIFIFFLLLCNIEIKAQQISRADSAIYFLSQVEGLQSRDSAFLEKAAEAIFQTQPDSIPADKIDAELDKLLPVIGNRNWLAMKTAVCWVLSYSKDIDDAVDYSRNLISELKVYSGDYERNLLDIMLGQSRFLYRNTGRINEGVEYYQRLANDLEQSGDSIATSRCYWALAGFYRTLGLLDKAVYCELKSMNFLNREKIARGINFPFQLSDNRALLSIINRKSVLGAILLDYDEPQKALPFLFEAKSMYESIKDSLEDTDEAFIYLQIIRAKMMTGGDSIDHYFAITKNMIDSINEPNYWANYYQIRGQYFYIQDRLDSAEYFIRESAAIKDTFGLMINSYCGNIIPGYYYAMIKIRQHRYDDAIKLLQNESNELLKVNLRKEALKEVILLSDAFKMKGDFENAAAILDQYISLQNQIIEDENRSRSMSFETEQQINSLNAEKQKQLQEIGRQKFIRKWITVGLAVVFVFSMIILFLRNRILKEKKRSEALLLNILPYETAKELKDKGKSDAKMFDEVTVMFTDFKDFTKISEKLTPSELVAEIDTCFKVFDDIITKHNIEKIKTIGDSYMCAGGLPVPNKTNATDVINAALEIRDFMLKRNSETGHPKFEIRIGIHTGPVVAGIVGIKKFAYDIWGDTVNIASRMESSGETGKVNISSSTYEIVKDKFTCTHRGKIMAKNKGEIDMYFVESVS